MAYGLKASSCDPIYLILTFTKQEVQGLFW